MARNKKEKPAKKPWSTRRKVLFALLLVLDVVLIGAAAWFWYDRYCQEQRIAQTVTIAQQYVEPGDEERPPQVDWAALKAQNPDVCAWVQIPDTPVNFPVYQGESNDTYLRTSADGSYSLGGLIFIDSENTGPDLVDEQTMVYGHHIKSDDPASSMFAWIDTLNNQEVFDEHPLVWWVTEQGTYRLTPLYTYVLPETDHMEVPLTWPTMEDFRKYLADDLAISEAKRPDAETVVPVTDHVLTMVTCNYDKYGRGRTLVVCVPEQTVAKAQGASS